MSTSFLTDIDTLYFYTGEHKNVALGKPAYQLAAADTLDPVFEHFPYLSPFHNRNRKAERAVDGFHFKDLSWKSCSQTIIGDQPWWAVDLLHMYEVHQVKLTNRGDCCGMEVE